MLQCGIRCVREQSLYYLAEDMLQNAEELQCVSIDPHAGIHVLYFAYIQYCSDKLLNMVNIFRIIRRKHFLLHL